MNALYYGDNLEILRKYIPDESVDLIYLDPPFNSKRAYNVIFKDKEGKYPPSQIRAFDDTWHWSEETEIALDELKKPEYPAQLYRTLEAFKTALGTTDMMAYLVMMGIRLCELHRVLKTTGSIYLHCDPTASHYLKIIMDQIFGVKNYLAEITWISTTDTGSSKARAKTFPRMYDIILFYSKTEKYFFRQQLKEYSDDYVSSKFKYNDNRGRFRWQVLKTYSEETFKKLKEEGRLKKTPESKYWYYKQYLYESKGIVIGNLWNDIMPLGPGSDESLGYPTQKPVALLERIIKTSSNEGDIVLDPFCGCGTTIAAAEKLNRKWIGIDITILAINIIEKRIKEHFSDAKFEVIGIPKDVDSARKLAQQSKFMFEQWFVTRLGGQPYKSTGGGDRGIDGFMYFKDNNGKDHTIILSVKGGNYTTSMVRDLKAVAERENASMGLLLALEEPTKGMRSEAASAGFFNMPGSQKKYPKIQIYTVAEYFEGKRPNIPNISGTLKNAKKMGRESGSLF